ncbi:MAG: beta-galactosidase [Intrasporangium sp.]|uniref:beta-galactosidase n=1 Tax=Intrasporangium sp. TaxID=1925024 RepID=UPI002649374F|nr:beta-galactosidase [Intrasporangium sp.]MDN5797961.1 beta-galactosidase [Intrasporangium sp.]
MTLSTKTLSTKTLSTKTLRTKTLRTKTVAALAALATAITGAVAASVPAAAAPGGPVATATSSASQVRPPAFPGNDGRSHRITWDEHSLKVDGKRLVVYSGELHYWRLPSPDQWRDVLQKLTASGFNAVSLYFFWGYHSSRPGQFDFTGVRDIDRLLTMAEQEGLYVIARPGPYINAEASMGGLPAYLANYGGAPRTLDEAKSVAADLDWLAHVDAIIKRHQLTDGGGSVIAYQVENEQISHGAKQIAYIDKLQQAVKDDGITVPLFHNDWGDGHGWNVPGGSGGSQLDLYAFDTYPLGFDCAGSRGRLGDYEARIRGYSPKTPVFIAEGQAGAFTAWGRDFQTSRCADFVDEPFTRQFAANNVANGATMTNAYMEYGGTNWGWTGDPGSGFTSYDYGAPIAEDRQVRPKMSAQKEYGYLFEAVAPIASAHAVSSPAFEQDGGGAVRVDQRLSSEDTARTSVSGNGARILTLRHADSDDTSTAHVTMPLDLSVVPQPPEPPSYRWNDSDTTTIRYTGDWTHASGQSWTSGDYQDDETFSNRAGDSVELSFTGPTIRWIAPDSSNHGTADVYVDGVKKATVDSYASSATFQQVKFEANDLGESEHTLRLVVTGQKGTPASQGTFISVDAFDTAPTVTPPPPPGPAAYPRIPQEGPGIAVQGRDATTLLADYRFGAHRLVYSTSQLLTTLSRSPQDAVVLDGATGTSGETVLRYRIRPRVEQLSGSGAKVTWDAKRHDLRLDYTHDGTTVVRISGGGAPSLLVILTNRDSVQSTWRLDAGRTDVLVMGAALVRTARMSLGTTLALTGDTASAATATLYAPPRVHRVTWNGQRVPAWRNRAGALVVHLPGTTQLTGSTVSTWRTATSDPERRPGFDDSGWRVADLQASENPRHAAGAQAGVVLDAEEYGFHEGDVWYRGRFTPGTAATSASVSVKTGTAGVALAWLDGAYLGSVGDGGHTVAIPAGALTPGEPAEVSVLVRNMGQYEDWSADGRSKGGRGLVDVAIDGAGPWVWRLQGAVGADEPVDIARGLYNNGGLWGERQGWHLPGAPDASWPSTQSLKSARPGVSFYRASVTVPRRDGTDTAWAIRFDDDGGKAGRYRALLFVNGWNTGQYVNNVGPQREFVIPSGFLEPGANTVALVVTAEQAGVGPDSVSLVNRWTVAGGVGAQPNDAPGWAQLFGP